jgi:protein-L-isoaspartate(D-aspartate) O-methyltransferase
MSNQSRLISLMMGAACLCAGAVAHADDPFTAARQDMIREIEADVKRTSLQLDKEALDPRVMQALATVPRHALVPESLQDVAYENRPLPIGHGQTISQPYIVAIMTDLLKVAPDSKVLEVGTGSGYQAAILAELVEKVYTIEIIEALGTRARGHLEALDYENITVRIGDGYYGWEEQAPFDGIVVTAAASHIPPPLIAQLKNGGRMIVPVGSRFMVQQLVLVEKDQQGEVVTRQILPVRFVPLTGTH